MSPIRLYRVMTCHTKIRVGLSVAAVAYSTVGAVAQGLALDRAPAISPWESPMLWISLAGLLLSLAGVLIGIGALVQTVKAMREQLEHESAAREAFEKHAADAFARKDVLAVVLEAIRNDLAALRQEQQ